MLSALDQLPVARELLHDELCILIERHSLWGGGIGLADAHLLGAALLTPRTLLWTRDPRLRAAAAKLCVAAPAVHRTAADRV